MLDTNICIALIRQRPASLISRVTTSAPGELGVSAITASELFHGAEKSNRAEQNRTAVEEFLLPFVVVEYDEVAARAYGQIRATLERTGTPIGAMDLLIAAHALALGVTLVTNNVREFRRVEGLVIEDWLSETQER
jgi:tRNA(fMet)-specific endonuclease VapC